MHYTSIIFIFKVDPAIQQGSNRKLAMGIAYLSQSFQ